MDAPSSLQGRPVPCGTEVTIPQRCAGPATTARRPGPEGSGSGNQTGLFPRHVTNRMERNQGARGGVDDGCARECLAAAAGGTAVGGAGLRRAAATAQGPHGTEPRRARRADLIQQVLLAAVPQRPAAPAPAGRGRPVPGRGRGRRPAAGGPGPRGAGVAARRRGTRPGAGAGAGPGADGGPGGGRDPSFALLAPGGVLRPGRRRAAAPGPAVDRLAADGRAGRGPPGLGVELRCRAAGAGISRTTCTRPSATGRRPSRSTRRGCA